MHRFGWLLIGFGALVLLGKGGFLFLPLFFFLPFLIWPLMGMLLFRGFAHGRGHGRGGYGYGRHGWHGHHGCGERGRGPTAAERVAQEGEEPRGYTGETTRL
jgi:hypothetical protein